MAQAQDSLHDTTIVSIATPPGRGGIGIVRLSGPDAFHIAKQLTTFQAQPEPRTAHYRILRDEVGIRIDDALLTFFPAPHSYTGEDVVEIATHGAPVVLDWVVRRAVALDATPARAGEFTERAFLHHRLDLTGAEAVRDLIDAQTLAQAQQAAAQMGGSIAAVIRPVKQQLIQLIATMEAGIDFAEDDIDTLPSEVIASRVGQVQQPLERLLASFARGRLLREGLRLAIIGKPNAGKSSLFNRLVQRERSIVTATPGTTRDVIAEHIMLDGIPVELLDTAGLRETTEEAERLGVVRSREAAADADVILLVVDVSDPASHEMEPTLLELLGGRPVILVNNKSDLLEADAPSCIAQSAVELQVAGTHAAWPHLRTSAITGEGLDALRNTVVRMARGNVAAAGNATLTNLRQHGAVEQAVAGLQKACEAAQTSTPHEMVLLDLHQSLEALDELTGATTTDDILHLIFSTFCIGK